MKKVVIIGTHPRSEKSLLQLIECINSFDKKDFDIILVSHIPIKDIKSLGVDYFVYDKNNDFLPPEKAPIFWYEVGGFRVETRSPSHALSVIRNIHNGIKLAKTLGYKTFFYTDSDTYIAKGEYGKFKELINQVDNKKMLFFQEKNQSMSPGKKFYKTSMFGGSVNFLSDTFIFPLNEIQWDEYIPGHLTIIEEYFYDFFSKYESEFLLINENLDTLFKSSRFDSSRILLPDVYLLPEKNNPNNCVLFIRNNGDADKIYDFEIAGDFNFTHLPPRYMYSQSVALNSGLLKVKVRSDSTNIKENNEIILDTNTTWENLRRNGIFEYK
jgi:hypothetical protein